MTTLQKIYDWLQDFECKWGEKPKNIPITRAEKLDIIESSQQHMVCVIRPTNDELFGIVSELNPFSVSLRQRRLEMDVSQYITESNIDDVMRNNCDLIASEMFRQLRMKIITDKTVVRVTFECDPLAGLKHKLHITKWFPIKQCTRDIDCTVLYPLCKVTLPHNKHTVHFSAR